MIELYHHGSSVCAAKVRFHIVRRLPEDKFQAFLNSTPPISVTAHWHERKKEIVMQGLDAPGLGATFRLYEGYLGKMEKALATRSWLAGRASRLPTSR